MKELLRKYLGLRLTFGIIYALIGITTVVFGILCQARVSLAFDPSLPLRIVIGALILLTGLVALLVFLTVEKEEWNLAAVLGCAALAGFGFSLFFENIGGVIIGYFIAYVVPIIAAAFGLFLLIKAIVQLKRKSKTLYCVLSIILAAALIAVGITFALKPADTQNITWILIGLAVMFVGGAEAVIAIRLMKAAKRIQAE